MSRKFVVVLLSLFAAPAFAYDLISAYRDALTYDAQYAAARANRDAGLEKAPQGLAGLLPNLAVSANSTWNAQDSTLRQDGAAPVNLRFNSNGWTAQLTQPLFRWQNWIAYRQGELGAAAAELQLANARQDLALRVAQAYFDVLLAQETLETAQTQLQAIAEQLESAKRSFELGTATITDAHEAQARHDLTQAQKIAAESDLLIKQHTLRMLLGKDISMLQALQRGIRLTRPQPDDVQQWISQAESGNFGVQLGENALETADREAEKQRAGHLPTLDFVATRGYNAQGSTLNIGTVRPGSDTNTTTFGVQAAIPIYSGGSTASKTREAVALREKALAELDNARRTAALNAKQAYLGVSSGLSQIQAYEAALVSSQASLEANKLSYQVGIRVNIDVLNAQSQLYDTRQKLTKAKLDTLIAQLKLKASIGALAEEDLLAINRLLE